MLFPGISGGLLRMSLAAWELSHESGGRGWLVLKLPQAPQRIFPENPLHQVVGFGTCRRSRETLCGARRALSMWTCTGVSHKPHTVTENEWMLLQRRKHNLSIGSPQCKKRASVFLHKSTGGASELGPLGKLAGFWSQALIGSVMAARNPPESGTRPGPFRRDTRPLIGCRKFRRQK